MNELSLINHESFKRYSCTSIFILEEEYCYSGFLKMKAVPNAWRGDQYLKITVAIFISKIKI